MDSAEWDSWIRERPERGEIARRILEIVAQDDHEYHETEDIFELAVFLLERKRSEERRANRLKIVDSMDRALNRALRLKISCEPIGIKMWSVGSQSRRMVHRVVQDERGWWCSCESSRYCAHIARAQFDAGVFRTERDKVMLG